MNMVRPIPPVLKEYFDTKEYLEGILGYEIIDFKVEPINCNGEIIVNIKVIPKKSVEYININIEILKTGVEFNEK